MASIFNLHEFNHYKPEVQEKIRQEVLNDVTAVKVNNVFKHVIKSSGYFSEWEDDTVVLCMAPDRGAAMKATFDLNKVYLQCKGDMSIFSGVMPLTAFKNLTLTAKAYLNLVDQTFKQSTKKRSEVTQNFNCVCRFLSG